jgi:hypothetical protein
MQADLAAMAAANVHTLEYLASAPMEMEDDGGEGVGGGGV